MWLQHLSIPRIRQVWITVWIIFTITFTIIPYVVMTLRMPGGRDEQAVTAMRGRTWQRPDRGALSESWGLPDEVNGFRVV